MLSTPSARSAPIISPSSPPARSSPTRRRPSAAEAFAALERRLASYKPSRKQGLFGRLFADKDEPPPRGLYVHGEVGRGKTMLMDLFFQHSPVAHKRRAHFHEFMAEVHERIYGYRQNIARGETRRWRRDRADRAARSSTRRGCCASTNSMSPTSRMR